MRVIYSVLMLCLLSIQCIEFSSSSSVSYASTGKESEDRCDDNCSFCPAYHGDWYQFKCTPNNIELSVGYCMTRDANESLFVTKCPYFQLKGHNVSDPGNFKLPDNVSELNDYMTLCGPMNRKGFLCEDCVDGFAVSFTSMGHKCSNCTDAWYGIPLYLLIELAPITVFYLVILIFQVHITSAPMTCFIFGCGSMQYILVNDRFPPVERIVPLYENNILFKINVFFYSLWNLDLLRYVVPPFCVDRDFKLIHTILLGYVSVLYPLCLIALTWLCIKLHDENFKPVVWLWRPFHRCLVKIRRGYGSNNDIIDAFSAFFLLSYSKLTFQCSFFLACTEIRSVCDDSYYKIAMEYDPTILCSGPRYYQVAVPALLCLFIFNILPALLLVFYPIKVFRNCLTKCKLDSLSLTAFTERFYGCYRDGLDGGRDMRSFAGFYFLLRFLPFFFYGFQLQHTFLTLWNYCVLIFLLSTILIALVQPYKSTYMNVLDTLMLGLIPYACAGLSQDMTHNFEHIVTQLIIVFFFPSIAFGLILLLCILNKLYKWHSSVVKAKLQGYSISEPDDQLKPLLDDQ